VYMVARRVRLNPLESLRSNTSRQNQMALQRIILRHQGGEPHSNLERDPRFLWNDRHGA